jgi:2-haloacid dehalogenase
VTAALTTVVFDLGNVLLDWDPRRLYRTLIDDPDELDRFLTEICSPSWHYAQDRGRPVAEATAELQAAHPEHAELIGAFYPGWPEMTAGAMPATVDILRELRDAGVRLIALTNWPAEVFGPARDRFEFFAWFEGIVVSGEERLAKPDPAIFSRLLDRYDVEPATAAYVDDTPGHVETARSLGLTGFVYHDAVGLRRDFASVGLPVAADVDVRAAEDGDAEQLLRIYNHYVTTGGATFDLDPVPVDRAAEFFEHYASTGPHRLLVATVANRVVGYATSGQLRSRPAYDASVEVTVYLAPDAAGRGIGSMLYQQLLADLAAEGLHRALAVIAQPNPASVALHRRFGFTEVGTMHEVGRKHGRWWDVLWMERAIP